MQRVKADNAELQRRVSELASLEAAKKKAESRADQLEEKVCVYLVLFQQNEGRLLGWGRWIPPFTSGLHRRRMSSTPHTTRRCATTKKGAPPLSYFPLLLFVELVLREQGLHRQVSLLKDQLRDLRMSNESTEARLMDQSQRLGRVSF